MIFIFYIAVHTYFLFVIIIIVVVVAHVWVFAASTQISCDYKVTFCDVASLCMYIRRNIFVITIFYAFLEFNQLKLECLCTAENEKIFQLLDDVDLKDKEREKDTRRYRKIQNEKPDKEFNFFAMLFLLNLLLSLPLASFFSS